MASVAAGARSLDGHVVGVLPGLVGPVPMGVHGGIHDLSVVIATGLGEARNAVLVNSADAVIVVGGSWGTLSEVALAMRRGGVPVVCLGGWRIFDAEGQPVAGLHYASDPDEAVELALGDGQAG
jgi:uncharacterized protein (TIGR00725 family)